MSTSVVHYAFHRINFFSVLHVNTVVDMFESINAFIARRYLCAKAYTTVSFSSVKKLLDINSTTLKESFPLPLFFDLVCDPEHINTSPDFLACKLQEISHSK